MCVCVVNGVARFLRYCCPICCTLYYEDHVIEYKQGDTVVPGGIANEPLAPLSGGKNGVA